MPKELDGVYLLIMILIIIFLLSRFGKSLDSSKDESISNAFTLGLNISGSLIGRPGWDNIGIATGNIKMYEDDNERFSEIYYKFL